MRILERDLELARLGELWTQARAGAGRLVLVAGEAGAGKSSLVAEFIRSVAAPARVLTGWCDPGATPRPLGPLVDVADALAVAADLAEPEPQRSTLFPRVLAALARTPTILVLEDVHWADEATLDLLRHLGRRLRDHPVMLVATYRDDEVTGAHPLSGVMGDLATGSHRLRLTVLSADAVAALAGAAGRAVDVEGLHRSTGGNPFFVTEVLAAGGGELPSTVRDAVLARAGRLPADAREVLDAAAVMGPSVEIPVLVGVTGQPGAAVDRCVRGGMLVDRGPSVTFRHELARQAVIQDLLPGARVELHRRVLAWLSETGSTDHRRLAEHAVGCDDHAAVLRHAPRAADEAARLGSHREAAEHLRRALRFGATLPAEDRADLLDHLSYQCYLTDELAEALDARRAAVALHTAAGQTRSVGVGERWISRLSWFFGRGADADHYALRAVATLEPLGPGSDLAMACSNVSQVRMLGGHRDDALTWGRRALAQARAIGDRQVQSHALNNIGSAMLQNADVAEGWASLQQSLDLARADGLEEHAARAWTNIACELTAHRRFADAERTLRTGITYSRDRDLDSWTDYMQGWLALVLLEQGRPDDAEGQARHVVGRPRLSPVSRFPAALALASLSVRRGTTTGAPYLDEIAEFAADSTEPQRRQPVALLLAEAAWTADRLGDIGPAVEPAWPDTLADGQPWIVAELNWWRTLGGIADGSAVGGRPAPFALMAVGRTREAAEAWTAINRPMWTALALAAGNAAQTSEAVTILLRIGADATAQAVRRDAARRGLPAPRGSRRPARTNPAGLTARQLEILRCLVAGLSDAEIATRLVLSERTVGHHVSAVLRKLGVPSRARAVAVGGPLLGDQNG